MALKTQSQRSRRTKIYGIQILNQEHRIVLKKLIMLSVISGWALNEQVLQALGIWDELFDFIYDVSWVKLFRLDMHYVES